MNMISFFKQYVTHPMTVGAILPSSNNLACKMVEDIDFERAKCIVEFGPGTGAFTEVLLKNRSNNTMLLLMETNKEFYNTLKDKYKYEKNLFIVNDSAENIGKYLSLYLLGKADYIVSGLPFTSLPKETSNTIFNNANMFLKKEGRFIMFQYTLLKKDFITSFFKTIKIKRVWINVPPAYVLTCKI